MSTDESQAQAAGDGEPADGEEEWETLFAEDVDSGTQEAFDALHDPIGWLGRRHVQLQAGTKVKAEIVNHELGLRKRIIRVEPAKGRNTGTVKITFTKQPLTDDGPEAIGYKLKGVDD